MNRLLLEYISKIISENSNILKEADPKKPGDVWDTGTNWAGKNQEGKIEYFPKTDPTSQQAAYAWAMGRTGTQMPSGEPASIDTSPAPEPQSPAPPDAPPAEDEDPSFSTEEALRVAAGLKERLGSLGGGKNQRIVARRIEELIAALESGDVEKIMAAVMDPEYPIKLSGAGRIKFGGFSSKTYFPPNKNEDDMSFNNDFFNLLRKIPELNDVFESDESVNRQAFKPSTIISDEDEPEIHEDGKGITLRQGGSKENDVNVRETDVSDEAIKTRVEEIIEENPGFKNALDKCSGDVECQSKIKESIASAVRRKRQAHNRNVQSLINCEQTRLAAKNDPKKKNPPRNSCVRALKSGQAGIEEIVDALRTRLRDLGLEGNKAAEDAIGAFSGLGTIEPPVTKKKIEAVVAKIMKNLENSPLNKTIPYMGELIAAAVLTSMGQTVMIPTSEQFPIADVFSLVNSPMLGAQELRAIMVDIGVEPEADDPDELVFRFGNWSVKLDGGGASGNAGKMEYTEFDSPDVADDLTVLIGLHRTGDGGIFNTRGEPSEIEQNLNNYEQTVMDTMGKYETDIRLYYGFPDTAPPTLYEIAKMLSTGSKLKCSADGIPVAAPDSSIVSNAAGVSSLNERMWRLASLNGFVTEAIHNRRVTRQQYFGFMARKKQGDFATTDGKYTMLAMGFQHYKEKRLSGEYIVPDGGQSGFTVPATVEEMRTMGTPRGCGSKKTNEDICQDDMYKNVLEEVLRILNRKEV